MIISNGSMDFDDPGEFDDPQLFYDPKLFDDPQLFDDQLEVWTLIYGDTFISDGLVFFR